MPMSTEREHRGLVEAAAALLEGAGGSLPITSLNKALFYLDLSALLESGNTITGTTYLALPAGPVVAKYDKRVVGALESAGIAQQDEAEDGPTKPVCLIQIPTRSTLSEAQWQAAQRRGAWAASKKPSELSRLSHENVGWKLAWQAGLGARKPAVKIDLVVAMQQILDNDAWLDREDAASTEAVRDADGDSGERW